LQRVDADNVAPDTIDQAPVRPPGDINPGVEVGVGLPYLAARQVEDRHPKVRAECDLLAVRRPTQAERSGRHGRQRGDRAAGDINLEEVATRSASIRAEHNSAAVGRPGKLSDTAVRSDRRHKFAQPAAVRVHQHHPRPRLRLFR
jgi:hypothetical protein